MTLGHDVVIHFNELKLKAVIGTRPDERERVQELLADIHFHYDASLPAETDALHHAVDYAGMHERIVTRVASTKFLLLERLGAFILSIIMEEPKVTAANVILEKFNALAGMKSVSVQMSVKRSKDGHISTIRCY